MEQHFVHNILWENPCAVKPVYRKCFINTWEWKDRMVVVGDIVLWGGLLTYMAFILECLASIQQSSYPVNPLFVCFSVGGVRFAGNFPGSRQAGAWESSCGLEHARGTTGEILSGGPQVRSCQGDHRGDLVRGTTGEILSGGPQGRYC